VLVAPSLAAAAVAGALVAAAPPPLKSVAYQPEPLSWKPAAVSCLLNVSWPQEGHCVKGSSEIFLQDVLGMAAGPAFVGINGHGRIFLENPEL